MKKAALIAITVFAIAAGGYYLVQRSNASITSTASTTIYGNVDIRSVNLAFRAAGRVQEVKVDEGASVKAGEVLAQLDSEPQQNAVRAAEASLEALSARNALLHKGQRTEDIDQARARVQAAQAALLDADAQLARTRQLIGNGFASQRTLDGALALRDQAAAQLKVTQEQLRALSKGFRGEEIAESDALLAANRVNLDVAKLALRDTTLTAPTDGIILTRAVEKGAMVANGTPVFSLSLTQPVWVRAYVSEPLLGRYASGNKVLLHTDARPGQPYHGVVGFVSPTAEFTPKAVETVDLRTALVYRLRIVVVDADAQLRQGMPVSISLTQ